MRIRILAFLLLFTIGITPLNLASLDSAVASDSKITTCTSLKSGAIYLSKTDRCNERIYESSTWYKEGLAPTGTPGSKIVSLTLCRSKSKPESMTLRTKCNIRTQVTTTWQRPLGPPEAPSIVTITAGALGTATIATKAPVEDGGARITSLTLLANPTSSEGKTARASSIFNLNASGVMKITGLTPGATYEFTLIANNAVGASVPSQASPTFLAPTVPGPATLIAVSTTGSRSAQITYSAPAFDGGSPIISYTVTSFPGGVKATVNRSTAGTIEISGLASLATYTFTITANNIAGSSVSSSASSSITTLAPPPPVVVEPTPALAAPTFTLSSSSETVIVDMAATGFRIVSTGGAIASFAINATPAGMSFNTSTGALTGTPTSVAGATTYIVTATNTSGTASRTFVLTVSAALSSDATLSTTSTIKGQTPLVLGTPNATLASATGGSVTLSAVQADDTSNAGSYITAFTKTNSGATVDRIVKYATGATYTGFATDTVYNGTSAISAGDFFIVKVTAADGTTMLYYKITAKLTPTFSAWANLSKPAAGGDFVLRAPTVTGAISGTFVYSSASTGVITISSSTAHIVATGTSVISATFTPTNTVAYSSAATTMTITVSSGDYIVGMDGPGGGKVFYVATSIFACGPTLAVNCKFLESAPSGWYSTLDPTTNWSSNIDTVVNTSGTSQLTGIGEGYKNSLAIIAQNSSAGYAATISRAYSGGTLNDWYLPAKAELNQMYIQRASVVIAQNVFWTSTEIDATHSWAQNFYNGNQESNLKNENDYVRPIRAFASTLMASRTLTIDSGSYSSSYTMVETAPTLTATSSAGTGTKSYTSSTAGVCTVGTSSGVVTFVSTGTCTVSARILSDGDYEQVDSASISFTLSLASQTLTWVPTTVIFMTETPKTPSSLASALGSPTITYSVTSAGTTGCTVNSSTAVLTFTAVGSCNVRATSSVTSVYESATKDVTFSITLATRTLSIDSGSYTSSYTMTATPPTLTSTPSVGSGSKSYSSSTTGVCTVGSSSGIVVFVSAGTCTISAVIASDGTYDTSTSAGISFSVTKTPTSLALFTNMNKTLGDPSFTLTQPSVSPSITGTFTYTSSDILTASISGSTVTIVARGSATITATFTPDNSTTYSSSTTTAILTIKQTPTFSAWANVSKYTTDSDFTISSPTANGGVTGTYSYFSATTGVISLTGTSADAHIAGVGTSVITATFTPSDTSFYNVATTTMTITVFRIGSIGPGGGKIFYYSVDGFNCGSGFTSTGSPTGGKCHYLEVAISATSPAWTDATYAWSGNTNTSIGTTSTAIGSGYKNTLAMISQNNTSNKAGTIVRVYTGGGFTDWYLPSKDELNELYSARTQIGGLGGLYYWSSSEYNNGNSWLQDFSNSFNQSASSKDGSNTVRPVRAF